MSCVTVFHRHNPVTNLGFLLQSDQYNQIEDSGTLTQISSQADPSTGSFRFVVLYATRRDIDPFALTVDLRNLHAGARNRLPDFLFLKIDNTGRDKISAAL